MTSYDRKFRDIVPARHQNVNVETVDVNDPFREEHNAILLKDFWEFLKILAVVQAVGLSIYAIICVVSKL